jgi:SAM-dependent methyltransferase
VPTLQPLTPEFVAGSNAGQPGDLLDRLLGRLAPGSLVLATGWGIGADLAEIAVRGHHVAGVEADGPSLEACRRRGVAVYAGELSSLPFAPGSFDAVWLPTGVGDLSSRSACSALTEMRRVLRPGGLLFAVASSGSGARSVPGPRRSTGEHSFADLVRAAGFRVELEEFGGQGWEGIGAHAT